MPGVHASAIEVVQRYEGVRRRPGSVKTPLENSIRPESVRKKHKHQQPGYMLLQRAVSWLAQFARTWDSLLARDATEATLPPSSSAAKEEGDVYAGTGDPPAPPPLPPLALVDRWAPPSTERGWRKDLTCMLYKFFTLCSGWPAQPQWQIRTTQAGTKNRSHTRG